MKRFNNIVYVLGENTCELSSTFNRAVGLAKLNQANLTLLKVLPEMPAKIISRFIGSNEKELQQKLLAKERDKIQALVAMLDTTLNAKAELKTGKQYIETVRAVQANQYDLVIKEADDIDWFDRLFGSDDMHLLRACPCPVWLIKKNGKVEHKKIVAAVDFDNELETSNSELNPMILELSSALALSDLATLHVVNAYDVPVAGFVSLWVEQPEKVERELFQAEYQERQYHMHSLMDSLKQKLGEESYNYLLPRTHLIKGLPARELPKFAEDVQADLVVMGTIARTGIAGIIIGNTAEAVLSQLRCSVLAIKPEGFISPIS